MAWAMQTVAHLPRAISYEQLGALIIADIYECLRAITVAMQTNDDAVKLTAVDAVIARMTSVKTSMRILVQLRHAGTPVVSRKQEARYLELLHPKREYNIKYKLLNEELNYDLDLQKRRAS